jgi:Uma2 family endonuclease
VFRDFLRGSLVFMPSPVPEHENLKSKILKQVLIYLPDDSSHRLYDNMGVSMSPYLPEIKDLKAFQRHFKKQLKKDTEEDAYLIPDIFAVFDYKKEDFNSNGYLKSPKWIIEIASPSTVSDDFTDKLEIYQFIGVQEYWVISDVKNVSVFLLENGKYQKVDYSLEDEEMKGIEYLEIPVSVFPDLKIKIKE